MSRLTDNDKKFGPITYAKSNWNPIRAVWSSGGGEEEDKRNSLTVYAFGYVARIWLPKILKPYAIRHKARYWDEATIKRMGRDWYDEFFPREYGFCVNDGHLSIYYGPQTHDSITTKHWGKFLPWKQLRQVRMGYLDLRGEAFWEQVGEQKGINAFDEMYKVKETIPKAHYLLQDFDGTPITAIVHLEQRVYRKGEGWFKWLGWLYRPEIVRRADISFSGETGPEKGSWKGGTMGVSTPIEMGMLHIDAINKYCAESHRSKSGEYRMKFIGLAYEPAAQGEPK